MSIALDEKLPDKTTTHIHINSKFKKKYTYLTKIVHHRIQEHFEEFLQAEDFADNIIEQLHEDEEIPEEIKEFQDLGTISITIMS